MASKRRNIFYENKRQETTENGSLTILQEFYRKNVPTTNQTAPMGLAIRRNRFGSTNTEQETTGHVGSWGWVLFRKYGFEHESKRTRTSPRYCWDLVDPASAYFPQLFPEQLEDVIDAILSVERLWSNHSTGAYQNMF
ncbi:hypothetical protein AAG570_011861 [Ranatra chinensis]|uniref:Uncharacterized protein n=1 Tax=Ranatra chinensis TaxID=642074 RepID=A0ABD0Z5G9_9HEMI